MPQNAGFNDMQRRVGLLFKGEENERVYVHQIHQTDAAADGDDDAEQQDDADNAQDAMGERLRDLAFAAQVVREDGFLSFGGSVAHAIGI